MVKTGQEHSCNEHLVAVDATTTSRYHFSDSGLPNVYLSGIRYFICATCKKIVKVEIPDIEELMAAIASAIVTKTSPLAGPEVKFLRKRLGIKGTDFAAMIDATPEQLSRWENGHNALSGAMDRYIRIAYTFISRDERLRSLMERVKHKFVEWSTSIHGVGANECIFAERMQNRKWHVQTGAVAA
jgi:DNA-binding transcriptional regulator YiaG